jgi:hypothetical protein
VAVIVERERLEDSTEDTPTSNAGVEVATAAIPTTTAAGSSAEETLLSTISLGLVIRTQIQQRLETVCRAVRSTHQSRYSAGTGTVF